jgi:hypothetical protein
MYTAIVGKTLLNEYNRRNGRSYSAREFFDEEIFTKVFDAKKYLFWPGNSPFVQGISKSKPFFDAEERLEKRNALHLKIAEGEQDASIALGFPASESKNYATTSGAITDLDLPLEEETIYLSWIGGTLSLGVAGGYTLLFDDPDIAYATFEGWQHYRDFLEDPLLAKVPGNKLTTWNGQWLAYYFEEYYDDRFNFSDLVKAGVFSQTASEMSINTVSWAKLFFCLATKLDYDSVTAYVFSLGSTNKTVGFIPFQFQSGRNLIGIYQQLFGEEEYRLKRTNEFEAWFGRHIKRACELGSIGLHALRPESLKKYYSDNTNLKFYSEEIAIKKNENPDDFQARLEKNRAKEQDVIISYQTYKTWLIAMLSKNKTDVSEYSRNIAHALVSYREGGRKNDRKNLLEKEFFKTNKKEMLKALDIIVSDPSVTNEIAEKMNSLRDQVHFLSQEDFAYFILLLKFDYAYAERNSQ